MNRSRHGLPRSSVKKYKKENLDLPVEIEEDLDPFIRIYVGEYELLIPKFQPDHDCSCDYCSKNTKSEEE
jgi:hypothetical protein